MLGPIGSDIMAIFRLLSPDEIDKYIVRDESEEIGESMPMAANGGQMQFDDEEPHQQNQKPKKFPKDHQAKVLPLNELSTIHKNVKHAQAKTSNEQLSSKDAQYIAQNSNKEINHRASEHSSDLASMGILSSSTIRQIENERRKKENDNKDSATVFLLKERQKMRESKKRMIEQQAIKSYQTNAAQEFYDEPEDDLSEDEGHNDLKGILLNKRHY
jgi:hypothetical protein